MPVSTGSGVNVNSLERFRTKLGLGWADVAEIMGVDTSTVHRWRSGESTPRPLAWSRLEQVNELLQMLPRLFAGPDLARKWIHDSQPAMLGGHDTPLAVMKAGRIDRVLALVQSLARGA